MDGMNAPVVAIASASAATVARSRPFVQLNSVSLSFGGPNGLLALDRVSIEVSDGEFAAVVGPSGCGKSTFLADTVYVLSKRPGTVICRKRVDVPRPRTIANSFEPHFVDIVHELRDEIMQARA
jgi:ABC-type nitrate/sulfonate/bicarbonate transport system ATPase subunit